HRHVRTRYRRGRRESGEARSNAPRRDCRNAEGNAVRAAVWSVRRGRDTARRSRALRQRPQIARGTLTSGLSGLPTPSRGTPFALFRTLEEETDGRAFHAKGRGQADRSETACNFTIRI